MALRVEVDLGSLPFLDSELFSHLPSRDHNLKATVVTPLLDSAETDLLFHTRRSPGVYLHTAMILGGCRRGAVIPEILGDPECMFS